MNTEPLPLPPTVTATRVAIGLGSNLGDRIGNLGFGLSRIRGLLTDVTVSSVYETEPLHVLEQPHFLNACCVGLTSLSATGLLDALKEVECAAGRPAERRRYGPRSLDLDILLFGDDQLETEALQVPHPRLRERAFVLVPLAEIAGDWRYPGSLDTVRELADRVNTRGVRRINSFGGLEADTEAG